MPGLVGEPAADLLLPNDGDLTYAKIRLDAASAGAVPRILPALEDPLARAVIWAGVLDAVRDAQWPVTELAELVGAALPDERHVVIVEDVFTLTRRLVDCYLDPALRLPTMSVVNQAAGRLLDRSVPGGSLQLAAARGFIGTAADTALLRAWLDDAAPDGLAVDADLRWRVQHRLVVLGGADENEIAAELSNDRTSTGEQRAAQCRAALPDPVAKRRAWDALVNDATLSNRLIEATAQGFWHPEQAALTESYVERYFADMPRATARRTAWVAEQLAAYAFPRYAVAQSTRDAAARLLAVPDLEPGLRRAVIDADDELGRALTARARAAGSAS